MHVCEQGIYINRMISNDILLKPCQRKAWWNVPAKYYNNGTVAEWFDVGTINMELGFPQEERDCRH